MHHERIRAIAWLALHCGRHDFFRFADEVDSEDLDFWTHLFSHYPDGPATDSKAFNFAKLMMHLDRILGILKSVNNVKHIAMKLSWVLPKRMRPKQKNSIDVMSAEDLVKVLDKKVRSL